MSGGGARPEEGRLGAMGIHWGRVRWQETVMKRLTAMAGLALVLSLGGCAASHTVEIRNDTNRRLSAELVRMGAPDEQKVVTQRRFEPGQRSAVQGFDLAEGEIVFVRLTVPGDPNSPQKVSVGPGKTKLRVSQIGDVPGAPIQVGPMEP